MDQNAVSSITFYAAIISALVSVASVALGSILSAWINQRGAKKVKQTELFFHEKVTAYYDFLSASDRYLDSAEELITFSELSTKALLFSSERTQNLIGQYGEAINNTLRLNNSGDTRAINWATNVGKIKAQLIKAMQKELSE